MRNVNSSNARVTKTLNDFASDNKLNLEIIEIDVTSDESIALAMTKIPTVYALINNAGRGFGGAVEGFTSEECLAQLDLNVVGDIRMAKELSFWTN